MSYSLQILQDNPLAYWTLSNKTTGIATASYSSGSVVTASISSDLLIDSVNSASAYFISPSYFTPPLVVDSASSYKINGASSNQIIIENVFDAFYKSFENNTFSVELWFSFEKIFDGSGYTKNSSSATSYFKENQLIIMRLVTKNGQFGKLYFDYKTGTIRFGIDGGQEAFYVIKNMDSSLHIVATYNAGSLSLKVNGDPGITGQVSTQNLFDNNYKTSASPVKTYFVFEPSSLNNSTYYLINSIAMYNYEISQRQCRNHIKWALRDDNPQGIAIMENLSSFEEDDKASSILWSKKISGTNFLKNGKVFNLAISGQGLTHLKIPNLFPYASSSTVVTAASGTSFSSSNGLIFANPYKYFDNGSFTLTSQVYRKATGSTDYVLSVSSINGNDEIYASLSNSGLTLFYYDSVAASAYSLGTASITTPSVGWHDIGFSTDSENFYISLDSASFSSSLSSSQNIKLSPNSIFVVGNRRRDFKNNTNLVFKNFGMFNKLTDSFASFNFTTNRMFMAKLQGDLIISQSGYWQTMIPITMNNPLNIVSSRITWKSMDNCLVETSLDNGLTWITQTKDSTINYVQPQTIAGSVFNILLRTTLNTEYEILSTKQNFNNLNIALYSNIARNSKDEKYTLTANSDNSGYHSFITRSSNEKIITLPNQFGFHFAPESSSVAGFATISKNSSSISMSGIEFWFKVHEIQNGNNYLLSADSGGGQHPDVYVAGNTSKIRVNGPSGFKLYINGASVSDNTFVVSPNIPYHLFMDFSTPYSGSNLYINGKANTGKHAHATYGYINVWDSSITTPTASTRYNLYLSKNSASVTDVSSSSTYIYKSLTTDSASAYKIG